MYKNLPQKLILAIVALYSFSIFLVSCDGRNTNEFVSEKPNLISSNTNTRLYTQYFAPFSYLGAGYNITEDYANENSAYNQVIDINKFNNDYPSRVIVENPLSQDYNEEYGENAVEYLKKVSSKANFNML